jgi:hypothetical protein
MRHQSRVVILGMAVLSGWFSVTAQSSLLKSSLPPLTCRYCSALRASAIRGAVAAPITQPVRGRPA